MSSIIKFKQSNVFKKKPSSLASGELAIDLGGVVPKLYVGKKVGKNMEVLDVGHIIVSGVEPDKTKVHNGQMWFDSKVVKVKSDKVKSGFDWVELVSEVPFNLKEITFNYTLVQDDIDKVLVVKGTSDVVITLPSVGIELGSRFYIRRETDYSVEFKVGSGVKLIGPNVSDRIKPKFGLAEVILLRPNEWWIDRDVKPREEVFRFGVDMKANDVLVAGDAAKLGDPEMVIVVDSSINVDAMEWVTEGKTYKGMGMNHTYLGAGPYELILYDDEHADKITELKLNSLKLTGHIPDLRSFTALKVFKCFNNQLIGSIPDLSNCTKLSEFRCFYNKLTGSIPDLSKNIELSEFWCFNTQIDGTIPDLSNNTKLTFFLVYKNQLTGTIPSLSANIALVSFNCDYNKLTGNIPDLSKCKEIINFLCENNQLTGPIPSLSANIKLKEFKCSNNQLTGPIPSLSANAYLEIFNCYNNQLDGSIPSLSANINLKEFNCCNNKLTGPIPDLSAKSKLEKINFFNNKLTGPIPSLRDCEALSSFICRSNQLTGPIPDLSKNTKLISFWCNDNQLTGHIPDLSNNKALKAFDCNNNQLDGPIPVLTNKAELINFSCNSNQLTGHISSLSANTKLKAFECNNNQLDGPIPDLSNNSDLFIFSCGRNQITGTISDLGKNMQLQWFNCSYNKITGYTKSTATTAFKLSRNIMGIFVNNNSLTTAALNQLITDIYNSRKKFTKSGRQKPDWAGKRYLVPYLDISNNAGTLTGTYQAPTGTGAVPASPAEMLYELEHDTKKEGFRKWTIVK